jgi:hypothetical protein
VLGDYGAYRRCREQPFAFDRIVQMRRGLSAAYTHTPDGKMDRAS